MSGWPMMGPPGPGHFIEALKVDLEALRMLDQTMLWRRDYAMALQIIRNIRRNLAETQQRFDESFAKIEDYLSKITEGG